MRTVMRRARQPALTSNDHRARWPHEIGAAQSQFAGGKIDRTGQRVLFEQGFPHSSFRHDGFQPNSLGKRIGK